jgi:hypothetical protein
LKYNKFLAGVNRDKFYKKLVFNLKARLCLIAPGNCILRTPGKKKSLPGFNGQAFGRRAVMFSINTSLPAGFATGAGQ